MTTEVVRFINEAIRPSANELARMYYSLRTIQDRLDIPGGLQDVLDALSGKEPIDDGAAQDGRPIATPENVKLFLNQIAVLLNEFEANNKQVLQAILALSNRYQ